MKTSPTMAPEKVKINIEVVTDYICPWCYIGKQYLSYALQEIEKDYTIAVAYIPFQLNPDMPPEGKNRMEYRSKKFGSWERSQAMDAQVTGVGKTVGLAFNYDRIEVTPNTFKAHLLTTYAHSLNRHTELSKSIFESYFRYSKNIGDEHILLEIAEQQGLTEEEVVAVFKSEENNKRTRGLEDLYKARGVNSVPLFIIENQALSGAQSKDSLLQFITQNTNKNG
jgi:predicted DsbA family dithiol-disulfide isomerase